MTLETIVSVLGKVMHGKIGEVDRKLLRDSDVRSVLTTYFSEREVRPELVAVIRAPSLMKEYLEFSSDERLSLDEFVKEGSAKLESETFKRKGARLPLVLQFMRKNNIVSRIANIFPVFLQNRRSYQTFSGFLRGGMKKVTGSFEGSNLWNDAFHHIDGGFDYAAMFAAELNPDIKKYITTEDVYETDGVKEILSFFEHFKINRKLYDIFNFGYISKKCGVPGRRLYSNVAHRYFKSHGGFNYLFRRAEENNSELEKYKDNKSVLCIEGVQDFVAMFDSRDISLEFTPQQLVKQFGKRWSNLYQNIRKHFRENLGVDYFVREFVAKERPEILEHWVYNEKKAHWRKNVA